MCVYAKLIGNVPTAKWVEDYGRKPVMIGGMAVCAVGLGSIGFALDPALGTPWLIGCRFMIETIFLSRPYPGCVTVS